MNQGTYQLNGTSFDTARDLADECGVYTRLSKHGAEFIDVAGPAVRLAVFKSMLSTPATNDTDEEESSSSSD